MNFELSKAIPVLERTPNILNEMLNGIPSEWIHTSEGEDTWSPYDVIGHLIHGEKTDWMVRSKIILDAGERTFQPFDRFAQFEESTGKSLTELLDEFRRLRRANLKELLELKISRDDLAKKGIHPEFGEVDLSQLLAT